MGSGAQRQRLHLRRGTVQREIVIGRQYRAGLAFYADPVSAGAVSHDDAAVIPIRWRTERTCVRAKHCIAQLAGAGTGAAGLQEQAVARLRGERVQRRRSASLQRTRHVFIDRQRFGALLAQQAERIVAGAVAHAVDCQAVRAGRQFQEFVAAGSHVAAGHDLLGPRVQAPLGLVAQHAVEEEAGFFRDGKLVDVLLTWLCNGAADFMDAGRSLFRITLHGGLADADAFAVVAVLDAGIGAIFQASRQRGQ
ncbi:hypothetical protein GCM10027277_07890 [Pseudoduganella ginsengisoli]